MLDYIGGHALVRHPVFFFREEIKLERQALGGRLQLPHHQHQATVDSGKRAKVVFHRRPEKFEIDDVSGHNHSLRPFFRRKTFQFFFRTEPYGIHVDTQGTGYTAAAALAHAAPVFKRIAHEHVRGHGGYGFVPIPHLDGIQSDFFDYAVHVVFFKHYPVAGPQHVMGGQLDSGHEPEYGVFEYQHEHCRGSSESRYQCCKILFYKNTYNQYDPDAYYYDFQHLVNTFHRLVFQSLGFVGNPVQGGYEFADQPARNDYDINRKGLRKQIRPLGLPGEKQGERDLECHRRDKVENIVENIAVGEVIVPIVTRPKGNPAHEGNEQPAAKKINQISRNDYCACYDDADVPAHSRNY